MHLRIIYIFVLFILPKNIVVVQQLTKSQIDSINNNVLPILIKNGQLEDALLLNISLAENAKNIDYTRAVNAAYIRISGFLCTFGEHSESLRYLDLVDQDLTDKYDSDLRIKAYANYGRNYSRLKMNKRALDYLNKGIALYKKNEPNLHPNNLFNLYANKAHAFLDTEFVIDSTLFYLQRASEITQNSFINAVIANYYLKHNRNIDSAHVYLDKSKALIDRDDVTNYHRSIVYQADANLNKAIGNYNTAIEFYEKSLDISQQIKKYAEINLSYKLISETYQLMDQEAKAHEYLIKYTKFNDSINLEYKDNVNAVVNNFLVKQEKTHDRTRIRLYSILIVSILLSVLIIFMILYYFRKKRLRLVEERTQAIEQKEIETSKLKQKINLAFDEVVTLAQENHPSFLARFQEVYPDVCEKLLEVNPKLRNTELTLCAMIWLNFSSKEIAGFTFVQPKTVQTKKYRLRKKLRIPKDVNIYQWLKNL